MNTAVSAGFACRALGFIRRGPQGDEIPVLEEIEVGFPAGQIAWVSGPTGAGKSTLLHLLAGLLRPTRGVILADGQPVSRWLTAHRDRWRRQLGIVFQHDRLVPDLTVLENVILPLIPRSENIRALRARARHILEQVDLDACAGRRAAELSGGERQRAAAARALISTPRFLLVDEPFAHQDGDHARALHGLFRAAAQRGATVIVAAHGPTIPVAGDIDHHWQLANSRIAEVPCPSTRC